LGFSVLCPDLAPNYEKIVKPIFGSKGFMKKISEEFFPNNDPDEEFSKRNQIRFERYPFFKQTLFF